MDLIKCAMIIACSRSELRVVNSSRPNKLRVLLNYWHGIIFIYDKNELKKQARHQEHNNSTLLFTCTTRRLIKQKRMDINKKATTRKENRKKENFNHRP